MSEHTPGPWEYVPGDKHHGSYVTSEFGSTIADCYVMGENSFTGRRVVVPHMAEMAEHNARLIATAPELLEALRDAQLTLDYAAVYLTYEDGSLGAIQLSETREAINAAIAKVTGDIKP